MWMLAGILATITAAAPCGAIELGVERPDLARLFTPLTAAPGTYVVRATDRPVTSLAAALKACDPSPGPGAWLPTRPEVHEAFGQAGIYDRARLAQLFGGKRLTVVRGSLLQADGTDAYTLISPYPSPDMTTVHSGTLVIVVHVLRSRP